MTWRKYVAPDLPSQVPREMEAEEDEVVRVSVRGAPIRADTGYFRAGARSPFCIASSMAKMSAPSSMCFKGFAWQ